MKKSEPKKSSLDHFIDLTPNIGAYLFTFMTYDNYKKKKKQVKL